MWPSQRRKLQVFLYKELISKVISAGVVLLSSFRVEKMHHNFFCRDFDKRNLFVLSNVDSSQSMRNFFSGETLVL